jgi:3-oxoacyl-[acyl-carrier-protein] synthase-1
MGNHPFMIDKMGNSMVVCADFTLPIELAMTDRFLELALNPACEALRGLLERCQAPPRVSVLLALPEQRPGVPEYFQNSFAERLAFALGPEIHIQELRCYPLGHAGGLYCIEQAMSLLQSGKSQFCLVGGVDSYLEPQTLEWLDDLEQLHSESTIWGFCPGEGAGFCLLTSVEVATSFGLPTTIEFLSAASAKEANPIKTETVCIGQGLSEAFKKSLAYLPSDNQVHHTICDMNGEPYRGNEYGFAVLRSPGKFADDADFMTPADCWGDVGAASGPLFAILAAFAAKKEYAPGRNTFLWASSETGLRAGALLRSMIAKEHH